MIFENKKDQRVVGHKALKTIERSPEHSGFLY